jgi:hypothetical protein
MKKLLLASLVTAALLGASVASAGLMDKIAKPSLSDFESACQPDIKKLCPGVPVTKTLGCLKAQTPSKLTEVCSKKIFPTGASALTPATPGIPTGPSGK